MSYEPLQNFYKQIYELIEQIKELLGGGLGSGGTSAATITEGVDDSAQINTLQALVGSLRDEIVISSANFGSISTSSTGNQWQALANQACKYVSLQNVSDADVDIQRNGTGAIWTLSAGYGKTFRGITNANQLAIRKSDQSNTRVTLQYEWET
jgi:hypothetical protein